MEDIRDVARNLICVSTSPDFSLEEQHARMVSLCSSMLKLVSSLLVFQVGIPKQMVVCDPTTKRRKLSLSSELEVSHVPTPCLADIIEDLRCLSLKHGRVLSEYLGTSECIFELQGSILVSRVLFVQYMLKQQKQIPRMIPITFENQTVGVQRRWKEKIKYYELLQQYCNIIHQLSGDNGRMDSSQRLLLLLQDLIGACKPSLLDGQIYSLEESENNPTLSDIWSNLACQATYLYGYLLYHQKRYSEAISMFQRCVTEQYRYLDSACFTVLCLIASEKYMEALKSFEKLSSMVIPHKSFWYILYNIAVFYHHIEKYPFELKMLLCLQQTNTSITVQSQPTAAFLLSKKQTKNSLEVSLALLYYQTAKAALHCQNTAQACSSFLELFHLQNLPVFTDSNNILQMYNEFCFSLLECKQYKKCIFYCNKVLCLHPNDLLTFLYKADALFSQNEIISSKQVLKEAYATFTEVSDKNIMKHIINNLALTLFIVKDIVEILDLFAAHRPASALLVYNFCILHITMKKNTEACCIWFKHMEIPIDRTIDYYRTELSRRLAQLVPTLQLIHDDNNNPFLFRESHRVEEYQERRMEASNLQKEQLTKVCLHYWIHRTMGFTLYVSQQKGLQAIQVEEIIQNEMNKLRNDIEAQHTETSIEKEVTISISASKTATESSPASRSKAAAIHSPSPHPSISLHPSHIHELDNNILQRALHENSSETQEIWPGDTISFLRAYTSLFQGQDTSENVKNYLHGPTPSVNKLKEDDKAATDTQLQIDTVHWQAVANQLFLKHDQNKSYSASTFRQSCAGEVDESGVELSSFNSLVIGAGVGPFLTEFSNHFPTSTIMALERRDRFVAIQQEELLANAQNNIFLFRNSPNSAFIDRLTSSNNFFRFQFIRDVVPLMNELLPHEFEESLGQLFSIAQTSFFFLPNEKDIEVLPHIHFFEYWGSVEELIENACFAAGLFPPVITPLSDFSYRIYRVDMVESFKKVWKLGSGEEEWNVHFSFEPNQYLTSLVHPVAEVKRMKGDEKGYLCNGFPLRNFIDFDLSPVQKGTVASQLAFSDVLDVYEQTEIFAPLMLAPDQIYVSQSDFIFISIEKSLSSSFLKSSIGPSFYEPSRYEEIPLDKPFIPEKLPYEEKVSGDVKGEPYKPMIPFKDLEKVSEKEAEAEAVTSLTEDVSLPIAPMAWQQPKKTYYINEKDLLREEEESSALASSDNPGSRRLLWDWSDFNETYDTYKKDIYKNDDHPQEGKEVKVTRSLSTKMNAIQYLRKVAERDFSNIWSGLQYELEGNIQEDALWLVPNTGTGLLPIKLAKKFPSSSILSVEPSLKARTEQTRMIQLLGLQSRVLLCASSYYDFTTLNELSKRSTIVRYQILHGVDIFSLPLESREYYLALSLSTAATTFLYLPSYDRLSFIFDLLELEEEFNGREMEEYLFDIISRFTSIESVDIRSLEISHGTIWVIDVVKAIRSVDLGSQSYDIEFGVTTSDRSLTVRYQGIRLPSPVYGRKVDLFSLLALRCSNEKKSQLMASYLLLPLQDNMHPSTLFSDGFGILEYYSPRSVSGTSRMPTMASQVHNAERILSSEMQTLAGDDFSLLHLYSGNGDLSSLIAQNYPEASVVGVDPDASLHAQNNEIVEEHHIYNNLVCKKNPNQEFIDLVRRSPEFFQFLLVSNISQSVQGRFEESSVKNYFTGVASLGITTFFELPSSQMLSLVAATFYGDSMNSISFDLVDHPTYPWKESSLRFIHSLISGRGIHAVEISLLESTLSHEYVKLTITNMTRTVGHHFKLPNTFGENHARTYELNHLYGETFLRRQTDDSIIPYDEFGISLVAALRLHPSDVTKERLYQEFVQLPIYEDMAPWNIQWKAGTLRYVDKDSSADTFDWLLPYAYQFLISLINWKETVNLFDHCGPELRLPTGAPIVASCIGSSQALSTTCDDPESPVPCADDNCYPTFVECLRELAKIDKEFMENPFQEEHQKSTKPHHSPNPTDIQIK